MQTRQLGPFTVSAIGLGAMPMSMNNDKVYPEESQAIATIHAALDAGITLIDTADIYAPTLGHHGPQRDAGRQGHGRPTAATATTW